MSIDHAQEVTHKWVKSIMQHQRVSMKQLTEDTGIDRSNLSAWINGLRPMSKITKAMFYYYFNR